MLYGEVNATVTGSLVDLFTSNNSVFEMEATEKEEHSCGALTPVYLRPRSKSAFDISSNSSRAEAGVRGESPVKPGLHNRRSYEGIRTVSFSSDNAHEENDDLTDKNKRQKPSLRVTAADGAVPVGDAPETDEAPSSPQPIQKKDSLEVPATRSKSLPKAIVGAFSKLESNRDKQFHRLFENIPQDEKLIKSYPCALVRDVGLLVQGRMFISANWVCFNANILGFETKVVIPVDAIRVIFKTKYTLLVPSAISIHTDTDKHVFGSLLSRRATYKKLMAVWKGKSTNDDEEKSIASQDGSYSQDGRETSLTDDQVFEDEEDDSDRSQPFRSESRKMISGRAHRVKEDKDQDVQNTTRVGRSRFQTFTVQVKRLAESVRAMQLVLPLALLVICCLCVSSCVLACRIGRVQAQMQKFPDVAEALEWNRILVTSQSGHIDQVSRLRDSLVLSLQILNKMHSSLQLINRPPTTTNEMDSLPH